MTTYNTSNRKLQGGASWVVGSKLKLLDDAVFGIGTGSAAETMTSYDVSIKWDGTNLILDALADDTLIEIGDAAATQKSFDLKIYGDAASGADYLHWDASLSKLTTVGAAYIAGRTNDASGRGLVLSVRTTSSALSSSGAVTGSVVFNTTNNKLYVFNGSAWVSSSALS